MLTAGLLLLGAVLLALTLAERPVRRLPLSPALIYLVVGWAAGAALGAPDAALIEAHAGTLRVATELAVLISLFAVGLRLRVPPTLRAWRVALWLAGPGMVVTVLLATLAAAWLLHLPWAAALLLAAVLAPTDPVLASEVQTRSDDDRDALRLSLTAEGGLNDGSALPAVMLALGLMGLHPLGTFGARWWWVDLLWSIGGAAALGIALGLALGHALARRVDHGDGVHRDELLYVGAVALAYGLALLTRTSTFVLVFACGATLLWPLREDDSRPAQGGQALGREGQALADRLSSFGARIERLVEATTVLAVGMALYAVHISLEIVAFGLLLVMVVRPLAVWAVVRRGWVSKTQRRLVAWFGIRGIGTLFYLVFVIEHGVSGGIAEELLAAGLVAIALSIVLHGVSATPLMTAYQRRRNTMRVRREPGVADAADVTPEDDPAGPPR